MLSATGRQQRLHDVQSSSSQKSHFHGKYSVVQFLPDGAEGGGQVSAVVAGYRCLFLGEAHQFLSNGFDERSGRVVGRGRLLQGSGGSVAQAEGVQVGRSGRWLLQAIPGGLE